MNDVLHHLLTTFYYARGEMQASSLRRDNTEGGLGRLSRTELTPPTQQHTRLGAWDSGIPPLCSPPSLAGQGHRLPHPS